MVHLLENASAFFGAVGAIGSTPLCGHALSQRLEVSSEHLKCSESQEGDPKATEDADKPWDLVFPPTNSDGHDVVREGDYPNLKGLGVIERVSVNAGDAPANIGPSLESVQEIVVNCVEEIRLDGSSHDWDNRGGGLGKVPEQMM